MYKLKIVGGLEAATGAITEFRLPAPPCKVVLGRDPRAEWNLPDKSLSLSARHCEVVVGEGWAMLRDISTNGTYVNGANTRMPHDHALNPGDVFEIGPYRIEVLEDAPRPAPPVVVDVALEPPPRATVPPPTPMAEPSRARAVFRMRAGQPAKTAEDSGTDLPTMIRPTTRPTPLAAAPAAAPAPAPAPAAAAPAAAAPDAVLAALAAGLGAEASALAGQDAAEAARRAGALARAAVIALRRLLEQEARARRRLGSRQATPQAAREGNPLRAARTPEDALLRLLEGGLDGNAALRRAGDELATHHEHLMVCFAGAARRLAEDLDPARLESGVGNTAGPAGSETRRARLWELYSTIWESMGQEPGEPWTRGFIEAALLHLAAAYDADEQGGDSTRLAGPVR